MSFRSFAAVTRRRAHLFALVVPLLASLAWAPAAPAARVVAVGDVHGDLKGLQAILRDAAVVDAAGRWVGGKTTLVQTGDLLDRGPDSRAVLDFVMGLEREASRAGGRLIVLLGNHEVMNVLGDLRYVTGPGFAAYADEKSEQRRAAAGRQYAKWVTDHGATTSPTSLETEWLQNHPIGFVEHREAFGPRGRYGRWLRQRPTAVKVGDTLFVHGGISASVAVLTPDRINARIAEEFRAFDKACDELKAHDEILPFFSLVEIVQRATAVAKAAAPEQPNAGEKQGDQLARAGWPGVSALLTYRGWLLVNEDGPLWFRGFSQWSDAEGAAPVSAILEKQGAARLVLGHTPQEGGRIRMRWDGRVFLIDTGMLQGIEPGGRASALEIDGAQITAIYGDGRMLLRGDASPSGALRRSSAAKAAAR